MLAPTFDHVALFSFLLLLQWSIIEHQINLNLRQEWPMITKRVSAEVYFIAGHLPYDNTLPIDGGPLREQCFNDRVP